jgi:hypothetical protein
MKNFTLSQNNHIDFINNELIFASCRRIPNSFKNEIRASLKEILSLNLNKKIYLFLSGGSDSETIARCALTIKNFKFISVIINIDNGLNYLEVSRAISFCKSKKLKYRILNISSSEVLLNPEIKRIKKQYNCNSLSYLISIFATQLIYNKKSLLLFGTGDPALAFHRKKCCVVNVLEEITIFRYAKDNNLNIISNIFAWNPETFLSFLLSPEMIYFVQQQGVIYNSSIPLKEKLYQRIFKTPPREKSLEVLFARNYNHIDTPVFYTSLKEEIKYFTKNIGT